MVWQCTFSQPGSTSVPVTDSEAVAETVAVTVAAAVTGAATGVADSAPHSEAFTAEHCNERHPA